MALFARAKAAVKKVGQAIGSAVKKVVTGQSKISAFKAPSIAATKAKATVSKPTGGGGGGSWGTTTPAPTAPVKTTTTPKPVTQVKQLFAPIQRPSSGGGPRPNAVVQKAAVGTTTPSPAAGLPAIKAPTSASQITPTAPVTIPDNIAPTIGGIADSAAVTKGFQTQNDLITQGLQQQLAVEKERKGALSDLFNTTDDFESRAEVRQRLENQYNIQGQLAQIGSLQEGYNLTKSAMETETNQATDMMASGGFISRQQAAIERRYAPTLNRMAADINAKTAILSQNMDLMNQAVDDVVADQKFEFDRAKMFYEANMGSFDRLSGAYKDAYTAMLREKEVKYNDAREDARYVGELSMKWPNANIKPWDSITDAQQKVANVGGDLAYLRQVEAIKNAGTIGGGGGGVSVGGADVKILSANKANIDEIESLKTMAGMTGAVGSTWLTRAKTPIGKGNRQNFIATTELLAKQLTLDNLVKAKLAGATFGALSDSEWKILADSATKIGTWTRKDKNGNVTHYATTEANFKKELDKIGNFAKQDYVLKGGDPADVGVSQMTDGTYWAQNSDGSFTQIDI